MQLNLELTEVNLILSALAELPYKATMEIIPKIQQQAQEQLKEKTDE